MCDVKRSAVELSVVHVRRAGRTSTKLDHAAVRCQANRPHSGTLQVGGGAGYPLPCPLWGVPPRCPPAPLGGVPAPCLPPPLRGVGVWVPALLASCLVRWGALPPPGQPASGPRWGICPGQVGCTYPRGVYPPAPTPDRPVMRLPDPVRVSRFRWERTRARTPRTRAVRPADGRTHRPRGGSTPGIARGPRT